MSEVIDGVTVKYEVILTHIMIAVGMLKSLPRLPVCLRTNLMCLFVKKQTATSWMPKLAQIARRYVPN